MAFSSLVTIKTREQMQHILKYGKEFRAGNFTLYLLTDSQLPVVQVGAILPKRLAKRAVTRNCFRRQIYAQSYMWQQHFSGCYILVKLYKNLFAKNFVSASSAQLKQQIGLEISQLLQQAAQWKTLNA